MIIQLSPQVRADTISLSKSGDALTINGMVYDFSVIPDGATLPNAAEATKCPFFIGSVDRDAGELHVTLTLPITTGASDAAKYPQPIVSPADGIVELPK